MALERIARNALAQVHGFDHPEQFFLDLSGERPGKEKIFNLAGKLAAVSRECQPVVQPVLVDEGIESARRTDKTREARADRAG